MQFGFRTGNEEAGDHFTKVETIVVDTGSIHPRTNKRKLRKFFKSAWGIKSQYIKYFFKTQGLWDMERLGVTCPKTRHRLYEEALKWQSLIDSKTEPRT